MHFLSNQSRSIELTAIATTTARLIDQIARGYRHAYVAASPLVALVLDEMGLPVTVVRGTFGGETHLWVEADGYRLDASREYLDKGALVEEVGTPSAYVATERFPVSWSPDEAIDMFAGAFDFPEISSQRGRWLLTYLMDTFVSVPAATGAQIA
jgi:hypothetical protein